MATKEEQLKSFDKFIEHLEYGEDYSHRESGGALFFALAIIVGLLASFISTFAYDTIVNYLPNWARLTLVVVVFLVILAFIIPFMVMANKHINTRDDCRKMIGDINELRESIKDEIKETNNKAKK